MNPVLKYILIGLLVVGLVGITAFSIAYAQGDPPHPLETLADLLGMSEDELKEKLQAGKTLEDLAADAGVDLEDLKESLHSAWEDNFFVLIQEALDEGEITQDHADWLLEGLEKGFLGEGRWFGGRGRMGHFRDPGGNKPFGDHSDCENMEHPGCQLPKPWLNPSH
jgi:hypothetical protein